MAAKSKRKLKVEDASKEEKPGLSIKLEEGCVYVTTASLVIGIVSILIMMGKYYDAGPFG